MMPAAATRPYPAELRPTGKVHRIMGFDIKEVQPIPAGPYRLVVRFTFGKETVQASGHNPCEVRAAERTVARNPKVIDRIELRDSCGCLETIWSRHWDEAA